MYTYFKFKSGAVQFYKLNMVGLHTPNALRRTTLLVNDDLRIGMRFVVVKTYEVDIDYIKKDDKNRKTFSNFITT